VTDVTGIRILRRGWMLKITRAGNGEVVIKLSGRMGAENIGELEELISAETSSRRIVLDLKDLTLVDQDAVSFLRRCEADSLQLRNCPAYIRKWITGEGR
jgi:anti-anti-sigma regulatory factor